MRPTRSGALSSKRCASPTFDSGSDGMDRHDDAAALQQFGDDALIVARRAAHAVHVELLADQIDHA